MAGPFSLPANSFLSNFAGILLDNVIVLRSKGATCEGGPLFFAQIQAKRPTC